MSFDYFFINVDSNLLMYCYLLVQKRIDIFDKIVSPLPIAPKTCTAAPRLVQKDC